MQNGRENSKYLGEAQPSDYYAIHKMSKMVNLIEKILVVKG